MNFLFLFQAYDSENVVVSDVTKAVANSKTVTFAGKNGYWKESWKEEVPCMHSKPDACCHIRMSNRKNALPPFLKSSNALAKKTTRSLSSFLLMTMRLPVSTMGLCLVSSARAHGR